MSEIKHVIRMVDDQSPRLSVCLVCGRPVARGKGRRPRLLHGACARFRHFLAAATRAANQVQWRTGSPELAESRRLAFALANKLPFDRSRQARDRHGRFTVRAPDVLEPLTPTPEEYTAMELVQYARDELFRIMSGLRKGAN